MLLETDVQPAAADHSFAGVCFDVAAVGEFEATLSSVWVAGQLGTVSVFTAAGGWVGEGQTQQRALARSGWGNRNDAIDPARWRRVACVRCAASWHACVEVPLTPPIRVLPGRRVGLYVHSDAPNDGGLIYQSCARSDTLAASEHLHILPGLGHTSPTPFGTVDGWWASGRQRMRGPSGALGYSARRRFWSLHEASELPRSMRAAVMALLLCHARSGTAVGVLPLELLHRLLEKFCSWSWFEPATAEPHAAGERGEEDDGDEDEEPEDSGEGEAGEAAEPGQAGYRHSRRDSRHAILRRLPDESEDAMVANARLAWLDQQAATAAARGGRRGPRAGRGGGRGGRGAGQEQSREERAARKAAKQERREIERRARTEWQRTPAGASHTERLAAAHMAVRGRAGIGTPQPGFEPEPEPEPELEPEPEPEPEMDAEPEPEPELEGNVRLVVIAEASAGGKSRGKSKKPGGGGGASLTLALVVARSATVAELLAQAKNKLRLKRKGGKLVVAGTGAELAEGRRVGGLPDGTELRFVPPPKR